MTQAVSGIAAPAAPPQQPGRLGLAWLAVVVLAACAVVGSNTFSVRDRLLGSALPAPVAPAASRIAGQPGATQAPEQTSLRSAPWWQAVTTVEGTGNASVAPFAIGPEAIEWRATWSCAAGRLVVRAPGEPQPLVDAECPEGVGHAQRRGTTTLDVDAAGPWRLEIAQRIDTPLAEEPLPGMTAPGTKVLATGAFYKLDRVAVGNVSLYEQADGRYSVRLEDFWVTPSTSLQLRLSTAAEPKTTREYLSGRSQLLTVLDVTAGSLNYVPPVGVDPAEFRSVVVWNPSDNTVYAAASLESPS